MDKVVGDFSYEGVDAIPIEEDTREWKVYFDNNFWGHPKGDTRKGSVPERKFGSTGNLTGQDIIG